jgi:type VI secretion system protein VasD
MARRAASRALLLAGALFGCAGFPAHAELAPAADPVAIELTVVGGPELNPNSQGRPSPVVVRIFELSAADAFDAAGYEALFEHPAESLRGTLLAQEEFVLRPGDILQRDRSVPAKAGFLCIAAGFRDLEHATWRLSVAIKPGRRNFLLIDLDRDTIKVVPVDSSQK